jgi:integrase
MKEPMCNYVSKVPGSNNYHFRRKIPQDLIPHYNKKEIKKSLNTSERREAEKRSRILATQLDKEWELLRDRLVISTSVGDDSLAKQSSAIETTLIHPGTYRDVNFLRELEAETAKDRVNLPLPDPHNIEGYGRWYLAEFKAERRLAAQRGFHQQFRDRITAVLSEQEMRLEKGLYELPQSGYQSFHVTEAIRNACKALLNGEGPLAWTNTIVPPRSISQSERATPNVSTSLFAIVDKWAAESLRNQKTVDMYNRTAKRFRELVGVMPIQEITRQDVVSFKNELLKLNQTPANTNKQLIVLNTLLNYAKANAFIDENHASGVSIKIERTEKPRVSFDVIALNAIFSSPIYSDRHRPKAGAGEAAYWLPLLALFTGARLEELGQLHPSDVMEESYFDSNRHTAKAWIIRIRSSVEAGQKVKNLGSNRRVPIHSELVRLGFIAYASKAKKEGRYRIFDKLVADKYGTETAQFSKWFNRYLRITCGVNDKRMVFHSFRHTFKDFCRAAEITVGDQLTGHVSGSVGDSYGADNYPLGPLVNAIERYKVLGLDLSILAAA